MDPFLFTDDQWTAITAELQGLGRQDYSGDRQGLEIICGAFVGARTRLGRNLAAPKRAHDAWLNVASAARQLDEAIAGLEPAGAAAFTIVDGHRGEVAKLAAALPWIAREAQYFAELELHGTAKDVSNNADPGRDAFLRQLVRMWEAFGGKVSAGFDAHRGQADGPLVRFLGAVMSPALVAAGEKPLSANAIRGAVRKLKDGRHMAS